MKAIKVTVDGPREPRSKIRHQNFHPFAFGPQRFAPDPLMAGLPFKLPGNTTKISHNDGDPIDYFICNALFTDRLYKYCCIFGKPCWRY